MAETHPARKSGFIAVIGRPNAGKSTLLNRLLDTRLSVVTPKAQTTRERVLGILSEPRGQLVFIDTPGIHQAKEGGINEFMVSEASAALEAPNVIWYIVDPSSSAKHEETVLQLLSEAPRSPLFVLFNKLDRVRSVAWRENLDKLEAELLEALKARGMSPHAVRRISAEKGKGTSELLEETWALIPEGPIHYPDEEQLSDRPMRFFVAEKIREQLFLCLGEEIPYSCAVEIESMTEPETNAPAARPMTRIEATIYVERDSQKGIVVGKGGQKIKEVGTKARHSIEEFIGGPAYLGLRVKLLKDWSKNADAMKRFGYELPKTGKRRSR